MVTWSLGLSWSLRLLRDFTWCGRALLDVPILVLQTDHEMEAGESKYQCIGARRSPPSPLVVLQCSLLTKLSRFGVKAFKESNPLSQNLELRGNNLLVGVIVLLFSSV